MESEVVCQVLPLRDWLMIQEALMAAATQLGGSFTFSSMENRTALQRGLVDLRRDGDRITVFIRTGVASG